MSTNKHRAPRLTLVAVVAICGLQGLGPSAARAQDPSDGPQATPFTVAPRLLNQQEVVSALVRTYPADLRDAGIGGRVRVWFYIDDQGMVQRRLVAESSGNEALDQAALTVANVYRFSPAMNREKRVAVWISLPITFQAR